MTGRVVVIHKVADYTRWKSAFDAAEPNRWITALVSDAVRLGLIAEDEQEMMRTLTPAVVEALDRYALDRPDRIADAVRRLPQLLARLWDAAPPQADLGGLAAEA